MAQVADKLYLVEAAGSYGAFLKVTVTQRSIDYRGEREAVAKVAWDKLVGENSIGEVVEKRSPTRAFVAMLCELDNANRQFLYERFRATIKFKLIGLEWRDER